MNIQFTLNELMAAAVLAYAVTSLIIHAWETSALARRKSALANYRAKDLGRILRRCYRLFPADIIQFKGKTFHRGMKVHVTTMRKKDFEGQLIGLSRENMICVMTNRYIIAQELSMVSDMYVCAEDGNGAM